MASENAKQVAKDVINKVRKGQKIVFGKIIKRRGYSNSVSKRPSKVTKTKSYLSEIKPLVDRLENERDQIIKRLKKTRNKAKYRDLIDGLDKIIKNIQLLSGGATSREIIELDEKKYEHIIKREAERLCQKESIKE